MPSGRLGFWLIVVTLANLACQDSASDPGQNGSPPGFAPVFGDEGILTYSLAVSAEDTARLAATATQEIYVPAQLIVAGETVGVVGLRYKGSEGTLFNCFENGVQICPKVSFKIKFDHSDPQLRFRGLKRLNFHAMGDDPSLMHERLNYELFKAMGIVTPRTGYAEILLNGVLQGVFVVVENIDGRFAEEHFQEEGNIYKEVWPSHTNAEDFQAALETNEDKPDHSRILAFAQALLGTPPASRPAVLDAWVGLDYLLRYLAVDESITNFDGVRAFYCEQQGGSCSNHNYYWFASASRNRFWLIPWDVGDSLLLRDPFGGVPPWHQPGQNCDAAIPVEDFFLQPPGCDVVLRGLAATGTAAYRAAVQQFLTVFDVAALSQRLRTFAAQLAPAVAQDPFGPSPAAWRAAVAGLERDLEALRERTAANLGGVTVAPFGLAAPGLTDFETTTPLAAMIALSSETNPQSGGTHRLVRGGAIAGGQDVRFDFELANEIHGERAYSQWGVVRLPLALPSVALPGLVRVRLKVRADNVRALRIELDSAAYPNPEEAVRYGWRAIVGQGTSELVLELGAASLPEGAAGAALALPDVLSAVNGLLLAPEARGLDGSGVLPYGKNDVGFVEVDDIVFEAQ